MARLLMPRYEVYAVSDGTEALAVLEKDPDCLLLTALNMAPMSGAELLATVSARWQERLSQVIVVTGWPDPHRWVPPGVVVLNKPVAPQVILSAVEARCAESFSPPTCDEPYGGQSPS